MDTAVGTASVGTSGVKVSRRGFLGIASGAAFLVALVEAIGIAVASVWPRIEQKKILRMPVARVQDVPLNGGLTLMEQGLVVTRPEGGIKPLLPGAKTGLRGTAGDIIDKLAASARESGVVVLDNTCTHLGCKVSWLAREGMIVSPCHNGQFNLQGEVVGGPPPRPLERVAFSIENGQIVVEREVGT